MINYVNEWVTESIEFMSSSKLGAKCQNNMFVGDYKNGNLYMLKLNKDRTGIEFDNSQQSTGLSDRRVITTIASAVKPNYLFKTFVEERGYKRKPIEWEQEEKFRSLVGGYMTFNGQ